MNPGDLGKLSEDKAAQYLRSIGYRIEARRWACPLGELDIVAYDGDTLVFVEVRARSSNAYGFPAETVTVAKRTKIIKTALCYVKARALRPAGMRFDIIGFGAGGGPDHLINAFEAGGYTF